VIYNILKVEKKGDRWGGAHGRLRQEDQEF
jgi:hypothetical protein